MIYKKYGEVFKALRLQKNLSLNDIQNLSGVSKSTISQFENGKTMITYEKLVQALEVMSVTLYDYYLLLNNGNPDYFITEFEEIYDAFFDFEDGKLIDIYQKNKKFGTIESYIISLCAKAMYTKLSSNEIQTIESILISRSFWGLYELYIVFYTVEQVGLITLESITESLFSNKNGKIYIQKLPEYRRLTLSVLIKIIFIYIDKKEEKKVKKLIEIMDTLLVNSDLSYQMMVNFLKGYYVQEFEDEVKGRQAVSEVLCVLQTIGADKFKCILEKRIKGQYIKGEKYVFID